MELQVLEQNVIVQAFNNDNGMQSIIDQIKSQVEEKTKGVLWDLSKKKNRDEIASLAYAIARSKTAIDTEGKKLKEKYTVITSKIDADRKFARDELDAQRDRIRQPLTDWEQAEKDRKAKHENFISEIKKLSIQDNSSSQMIRDDIDFLTNEVVVDSSLEDYEQEAKLAKFETLEALRTTLAAREKYEAEQAEREAFEQAERIRWQKDHDERIAREATEKAQREAEEKARFEAERVQREKAELEQREARLVAEKEAAELRAVQAAENERKRIEAEQFAQAEAVRKAEEARLADEAHTKKVCAEALEHLALLPGVNEQLAKSILAAIYKGRIPHVSIKF